MLKMLAEGSLGFFELDSLVYGLKTGTLVLRTAASKIFLGLLGLLRGGHALSAVRYYHDGMTNAQVGDTINKFCTAVHIELAGCAKVVIVASDGALLQQKEGGRGTESDGPLARTPQQVSVY